ncbi:MAG: DUF488 domain-containing protein [Chloroflexi bacterium]|nr:DUF488 domain-containing protein [Chloroflexota bacterium]
MKLYTIGFTQKSAETFFGLLRQHGVQRLVDIRLNPNGQLSGFAKQNDLPYLLANLASCEYIYAPELAPTKEILEDYRKSSDWQQYVARFEALMNERGVPDILQRADFDERVSCLLCSEPTPERCHRRLVAERLAKAWLNVEVIHL